MLLTNINCECGISNCVQYHFGMSENMEFLVLEGDVLNFCELT